MKKIRNKVFETNSSSSHSLTLTKGALVEQPFSKDVLRKGTLTVYLNEYGWEWYRYYLPLNKIKYLMTYALSGDSEKFDDSALAQMLVAVVKEHTGVVIRVEGSGYIDHESVGVGYEAFSDTETLKDFIFGESSYVETGNDNSPCGVWISTDKGKELYDSNTVVELPKNWVTATFQVKSFAHWASSLEYKNGTRRAVALPEQLMQEIAGTGILVKVSLLTKGKETYCQWESPMDYAMRYVRDSQLRYWVDYQVDEVCKPHDSYTKVEGYKLQLRMPPELAAKVKELANG